MENNLTGMDGCEMCNQQTVDSSGGDGPLTTHNTGAPQGAYYYQPGILHTLSPELRHDESDEWRNKTNVLQVELQQLSPLVKENQRLRRCVGGVKVLSRALKQSKLEVKELKRLVNDSNHVTSRDPYTNNKDIGDSDQDASYNVPDVMLPPNNEFFQNQAEKSPTACLEEPTEKHEGRQSLRKDEIGGSGEDNRLERDKTKEIGQDLEKSDQEQRTVSAYDREIVPQREIQNKVVTIKEVGEVSEDEKVNQTEDQVISHGREVLWESSTAPQANEVEIGASTGLIGDADQDTADIAAVEALLCELSTSDTPTTTDQASPDEVASNVRSVATITDEGNSFVCQTLAKQEQSSLQMQITELKKANLNWERYCNKKNVEFIAQQKEKDLTVRNLKTQLDDACVEATKRAEHYDQMLLAAKTRIDESQERSKQQQSELDQERLRCDKSDQLNRYLAKQNQNMAEEITRLKKALERKYQQKVSATQPQSPPVIQTVDYTPQHRSPDTAKREYSSSILSTPKPRPTVIRRSITPPAVAQRAAGAPMPLKAPEDAESTEISKSPSGKKTKKHTLERRHAPAPYDDGWAAPHEIIKEQETKGVVAKSLHKHELTEQLELLRQQNQMFESDFNKEQSDKNRAINELQTLRRELNNRKGRLPGQGHRHQLKERAEDTVVSAKVQGPQQDVYKPPRVDRQSSPRKAHRQAELNPSPLDGKEVAVVQWGERTTCKLVNPNTVIIRAVPEGQRLNINLGGAVEKARKGRTMEPFQCPRCQRLFRGSEWESYEYHVTLCNI